MAAPVRAGLPAVMAGLLSGGQPLGQLGKEPSAMARVAPGMPMPAQAAPSVPAGMSFGNSQSLAPAPQENQVRQAEAAQQIDLMQRAEQLALMGRQDPQRAEAIALELGYPNFAAFYADVLGRAGLFGQQSMQPSPNLGAYAPTQGEFSR